MADDKKTTEEVAATALTGAELVRGVQSGLNVKITVDQIKAAIVASPLAVFAATTSAQLAGVISNETGSGALVFATSPSLVTPTLGAAAATSLTLTNGSLAINGTQTTLFSHNTTLDADADNLNLVCQVFPGVNAPDPRANFVYGFGYNIGPGGGRLNAAEPMLGIKWETYYNIGAVPNLEFHISSVGTTTGVERRHFSFNTPRDGVGPSILAVNAGSFELQTDAAVQKVKFDLDNNAVYLFNSTAINGRVNNTPVWTQRNAADSSYINGPYINAEDRLQISQSFQAVANTPTTGTYANVFAALTPNTLAANGTLLLATLPSSVTGALNAYTFVGGCSGNMTGALYNNDSGSGANARLELRTVSGTAGDPYMIYNVNGAGVWSVGLDNSDSDKFKICRAATLASNDALTIDAALNIVLGSAALATSATDGFIYIPTCAGTPTGVPTSHTGRAPIVYDSTNNKLYVYDGGWLATAALT